MGIYTLTHQHWASIWACEHTAYCSVRPGQHQIFAVQMRGALAIERTSSVSPFVHQPHWQMRTAATIKNSCPSHKKKSAGLRRSQCKWALIWLWALPGLPCKRWRLVCPRRSTTRRTLEPQSEFPDQKFPSDCFVALPSVFGLLRRVCRWVPALH